MVAYLNACTIIGSEYLQRGSPRISRNDMAVPSRTELDAGRGFDGKFQLLIVRGGGYTDRREREGEVDGGGKDTVVRVDEGGVFVTDEVLEFGSGGFENWVF